MRYGELEKIIKKNGCYYLKDGSNHEIWYSEITKRQFPFSRHKSQEVPTGTLKAIKKQAGIK
jgi:predicted RNA binding protein YcfA (HicA-like mRNA interferase family)